MWGGKGKPPTSLLHKARAASGGGTYRSVSIVSSPSSVGMAPSRALLYNKLLRVAHEEVPPQRREEGEPPPRRAASRVPAGTGCTPPGAPHNSNAPNTNRFCSQKGEREEHAASKEAQGSRPSPSRDPTIEIPRRKKSKMSPEKRGGLEFLLTFLGDILRISPTRVMRPPKAPHFGL